MKAFYSRFVKEVSNTDKNYLQLLAIIQRQIMEKLDMELIGRNYFDPHSANLIREYCLELWPGYITSIRSGNSTKKTQSLLIHQLVMQWQMLGLNSYLLTSIKPLNLDRISWFGYLNSVFITVSFNTQPLLHNVVSTFQVTQPQFALKYIAAHK